MRTLEERIQHVESIIAGYKQKDPRDFACQMARASMECHLEDLKRQLAESKGDTGVKGSKNPGD